MRSASRREKTRLAVYTYEADYLEMEVHMPELLAVRSRDLLTYECGYRSAFGGAMWKQPQSAVYVDYKSLSGRVITGG